MEGQYNGGAVVGEGLEMTFFRRALVRPIAPTLDAHDLHIARPYAATAMRYGNEIGNFYATSLGEEHPRADDAGMVSPVRYHDARENIYAQSPCGHRSSSVASAQANYGLSSPRDARYLRVAPFNSSTRNTSSAGTEYAPSQPLLASSGGMLGYTGSLNLYGAENVASPSPSTKRHRASYTVQTSGRTVDGSRNGKSQSMSANTHSANNVANTIARPDGISGHGQASSQKAPRRATLAATSSSYAAFIEAGSAIAPIELPDSPPLRCCRDKSRLTGSSSSAADTAEVSANVTGPASLLCRHGSKPAVCASKPTAGSSQQFVPPQPAESSQAAQARTLGAITQDQLRSMEGDNLAQAHILHVAQPDELERHLVERRLRWNRLQLARTRVFRDRHSGYQPLEVRQQGMDQQELANLRNIPPTRSNLIDSTHGQRPSHRMSMDSDATMSMPEDGDENETYAAGDDEE